MLAFRRMIPRIRLVALIACAAFGNATSAAVAVSFTGSDGVYAPASSSSLLPDDDGRFDFSAITVGSGVTVTADPAAYPNGLYMLASGDVDISGTLDALGVDLTIVTGGTFHLHPAGMTRAKTFRLVASEVVIDGALNATQGWGILILAAPAAGQDGRGDPGAPLSRPAGGSVLLSSANIPSLSLLSQIPTNDATIGPVTFGNAIAPLLGPQMPIVAPMPVPLPASVGLLMPLLAAFGLRRRRIE